MRRLFVPMREVDESDSTRSSSKKRVQFDLSKPNKKKTKKSSLSKAVQSNESESGNGSGNGRHKGNEDDPSFSYLAFYSSPRRSSSSSSSLSRKGMVDPGSRMRVWLFTVAFVVCAVVMVVSKTTTTKMKTKTVEMERQRQRQRLDRKLGTEQSCGAKYGDEHEHECLDEKSMSERNDLADPDTNEGATPTIVTERKDDDNNNNNNNDDDEEEKNEHGQMEQQSQSQWQDKNNNHKNNDGNDGCVDEHPLCADWAHIGECDVNPNYMRYHCRVSCGTCPTRKTLSTSTSTSTLTTDEDATFQQQRQTLAEATTAFGERQQAEGGHRYEILKHLEQSIAYMSSSSSSTTISTKTKTTREEYPECQNRHELCAFWAVIGECDANAAWMVTNCAPSCLSCHLIDVEARCPLRDDRVPGLVPGSLHDLFERLSSSSSSSSSSLDNNNNEFKHTVTVHSRDPWVVTFDDFLSPEECAHLIALGHEQGYERSRDVGARKFDGSYDGTESSSRTSHNAWCTSKTNCRSDPIVTTVLERIASVTGIPSNHYEDLQLLNYDVGQFYKQHHDYIPYQADRPCGPRILTFFLYLSDVEAGGGTAFPTLANNLTIVPRRGRALLWPSVLDSDPSRKDGRTEHEALPVHAGRKFAANAWIHLYDYLEPQRTGCN